MEAKKYNQVTPEILEQFKAIVPGKVYAGEEINSDYFHDEMPIYGKGGLLYTSPSPRDGLLYRMPPSA